LGRQLQDRWRSTHGSDSVLFVEADHRQLADCRNAVSTVLEWAGRIDGLFNNAGIVLLDRTAEETQEDEWAEVMALNVTSYWRMCKEVIPLMRYEDYIMYVCN